MKQIIIGRSLTFNYTTAANSFEPGIGAGALAAFKPLISSPLFPYQWAYFNKETICQINAVRFDIVGISGARMAVGNTEYSQGQAAIAAFNRLGVRVSDPFFSQVGQIGEWQEWSRTVEILDHSEDYRFEFDPSFVGLEIVRAYIDPLNIQAVYDPRPNCRITVELDLDYAGDLIP
jgi:hypothetical protein